MISDVTFAVFHYPMADLLWVSCRYAWLTHIHQSTCEYNFLTYGATFCPISDCHSGSLAFILIHNFSPLPRKHFGSFHVSCPPTCYTPRRVSVQKHFVKCVSKHFHENKQNNFNQYLNQTPTQPITPDKHWLSPKVSHIFKALHNTVLKVCILFRHQYAKFYLQCAMWKLYA